MGTSAGAAAGTAMASERKVLRHTQTGSWTSNTAATSWPVADGSLSCVGAETEAPSTPASIATGKPFCP